MVESERLLRKGNIRASTEKLYERVSKKDRISVSTRNWLNPGDYLEKVESVPLLKNSMDEYRKIVELVCVPKNGRIRTITGKT